MMEKPSERRRVDHNKTNVPGSNTFVCNLCDKAHDPEGQTFITIMGNVLIGRDGGLVGNNFDDEGCVNRLVILCRAGCAREYLERAVFEYCW